MLYTKPLATLLLIATIGFFACSKPDSVKHKVSVQSNETVLFWNEVAYQAFGAEHYQHSLMASRVNAMVQLAIHDALNGIEEKYQRYAFDGNDEKADPIAAAASAAYEVLISELPTRRSYLDSALQISLASSESGEGRNRGIDLGKLAAAAVLEKRKADGSEGEVIGQVPVSTIPGVYQVVPPFNFIFAKHWEDVLLFSLERKDQFRSQPHPELGSIAYTNAFDEVKETGSKNSTTRTPDQTALAKYWYEFSEAGWNRIARIAIKAKHLNMLEAARLLALVDMAIADAYIAGWDSKIHYNFWRPYTAIRSAANDGNEQTIPDGNWEPAEPTPPVQDYPSTHSALGNAAATVLARTLGNQFSFSMISPTALPANGARSFSSFLQAADENADSRVRAGIHFRFSTNAGQLMGNQIGAWVVEHSLLPID